MNETLSDLFGAYADYVGKSSAADLNKRGLLVWVCDDCGITVPVVASDPQAYGPVICPKCRGICDIGELPEEVDK